MGETKEMAEPKFNLDTLTVRCVVKDAVQPCKYCPTAITRGHWFNTFGFAGRRDICATGNSYETLTNVGGSLWVDASTLEPHMCAGTIAMHKREGWTESYIHPNRRVDENGELLYNPSPKNSTRKQREKLPSKKDAIPTPTPTPRDETPVPSPSDGDVPFPGGVPKPSDFVPPPTPTVPAPAPALETVVDDAAAALIRKALGIDIDQIRAELARDAKVQLNEHMERVNEKLRNARVDRIEIVAPNGETKSVDGAHRDFARVFKNIQLGGKPFLIGPRGSGKTTLARQIAKALDKPCLAVSANRQMKLSELFGGYDATGSFIVMPFVYYLRAGAVILLDEFDQAPEHVQMRLNDLIDSGYFLLMDSKPDDNGIPVAERTEAIFIGAANTIGAGTSPHYANGGKLSASTLDRFDPIFVDYDRDVERALIDALPFGSRKLKDAARNFVWNLRDNAAKNKVFADYGVRRMKVIIRGAIQGSDDDEMNTRVLREQLGDQDWRRLTDGLTFPKWSTLV